MERATKLGFPAAAPFNIPLNPLDPDVKKKGWS